MAILNRANKPGTAPADGNGAVSPPATEVTELDLRDPQFMATAYETYDALREKGRVTRIKFGSDEDGKESKSPGINSSTARRSSSPITTMSWPRCSMTASRSIRVLA